MPPVLCGALSRQDGAEPRHHTTYFRSRARISCQFRARQFFEPRRNRKLTLPSTQSILPPPFEERDWPCTLQQLLSFPSGVRPADHDQMFKFLIFGAVIQHARVRRPGPEIPLLFAQRKTKLVIAVTLMVTIAEFINLQRLMRRGRELQGTLFDVSFAGLVASGQDGARGQEQD